LGKRNAHAKGARPQDVETIGGSKIVEALCQRMSKSELTLVDIGGKKPETHSKGMNKAQSKGMAEREEHSMKSNGLQTCLH
jgi:hypothetical protein